MSNKIYFYYGSMNSGKTASLLINAYNYEEQGKNILILKPKSSTREDEGMVSSRIGLSHKALEFEEDDNLYYLLSEYKKQYKNKLDCIFIDEIHFATGMQIRELVLVCDVLNITVICYGLKNSYVDGELFESIKELLYQANSVMEIKSVCTYCNSKATHHLRVVNGKIIRDGNKKIVGDIKEADEKYISVCRKCYYQNIQYEE